MPGKVFLSCGQKTNREKKVAEKVRTLLKKEFKLDCYIAIEIQGFNDIMNITNELKSSDYFLFIDFHRKNEDELPLSLFTHQEFTLAHHLGFKELIAFRETGVPEVGFIKYVQSNPEPFGNDLELLEKVEGFIKKRGWNKDYSRNLVVDHIKEVGPFQYSDRTGPHWEIIWHAYISNHRSDTAAVNAVCILDYVVSPDGEKRKCNDRNYLKWATQFGYQRTILPEDYGIVDLFGIRTKERGIFLHSDWDMIIRTPIIRDDGNYKLYYKIFSDDFPLLEFTIEVDYQHSQPTKTKCKILQKQN